MQTSETVKHTPGPWSVAPGKNDMEPVIIQGDPGDPWFIATLHDMEKQTQANARLIAAAPDLLEALEAVLFAGWCGESSPITDNVRRVIAKARGQ